MIMIIIVARDCVWCGEEEGKRRVVGGRGERGGGTCESHNHHTAVH